MKFADIEIHDLVRVLGQERSAWIKVATEQKRPHTEAERVTICVLRRWNMPWRGCRNEVATREAAMAAFAKSWRRE
jgi:hypothetical protein